MAHYPRNFIQQVIFRLDFPISIEQLKAEEHPVSFQRALLQRLPIAQEHQQRGIEFRFTPNGQESHEVAKTTYHFLSDDEARKVGLDKDFLFVEENRFVSFEAVESSDCPSVLPSRYHRELGSRYAEDSGTTCRCGTPCTRV